MDNGEAPILVEERIMQEIEIPITSERLDVLPMKTETSCCSGCPFSGHENSVVTSKESSKSAKKLCGLIVFYAIVMVVELVGGIKAHSLAVIGDAAHLLSDITGFSISLFAVWASGWEATPHQSFGYNRLEVLGALISVQLIWLISGYLIYEAVGRILLQQASVNGKVMLAIATFGFVLNFIMVAWIGHDHSHHHHHGCEDSSHDHSHHHHHHEDSGHDHSHHHHHEDSGHYHSHHHHDHGNKELSIISDEESATLVSSSHTKTNVLNLNLQGAYLHVMADMIQSVGVMIAGAIIWAKPKWFIVDLVCTLIFSVLSLSATLPMLRNLYGILMESTPREIDISKLESGIRNIKGVQDVHDLHIWAITLGKLVLSCHVVAEPGISSIDLLGMIKHYCEKTYQIQHVTIQIE
ncbi:metal tolerance protein B-like [Vigna unguiculata]|uniref:metal tolerance protein B-like n=1 Tax=Vigna unguiculata TaxID=3917 RepID=UPI0010165E9F|nr:metal tolerance protein B-like [Vigna unguiculata]